MLQALYQPIERLLQTIYSMEVIPSKIDIKARRITIPTGSPPCHPTVKPFYLMHNSRTNNLLGSGIKSI